MSQLALTNFLKSTFPVNLFTCERKKSATLSTESEVEDTAENQQALENTVGENGVDDAHFSVIIDSECCLDRLYGGYYSDWASGGQWNRMLSYVGNLARACRTNNIELTVAFRGGLEKEYQSNIFRSNRDFKDRLSRVMLHLQNRGTPPPKVWWLPPTGLRDALSLAFHFYG